MLHLRVPQRRQQGSSYTSPRLASVTAGASTQVLRLLLGTAGKTTWYLMHCQSLTLLDKLGAEYI